MAMQRNFKIIYTVRVMIHLQPQINREQKINWLEQ